MCGRFAHTTPQETVEEHFEADVDSEKASALAVIDRPRHNITPTQDVAVIRLDESGARRLQAMRWGFLPEWWKTPTEGPVLINARSETIAEKPAFRQSARHRRCLLPADGFYEWKVRGEGAGAAKIPYWIHPSRPLNGPPLVFAGVWSEWSGPPDPSAAPQTIANVAIVTCAASERMSALHHRLPLAIAPEHYGLWLGQEGHGAARLMQSPVEDFYDFHPVSSAINAGGRNAPDGPELRAPVSEADVFAFDRAPRLL
ncbi:MAG: SOS response-associated peptidase [Rhodobacteraceae bacterium]|nr:SOS response-associated peptidase [Paracoccaceae bacterium]